ncbi:hypothetical protein NP233_g5981 [Leucocoprinus birnbaumii]|uniref:DUF6534 domain-containing protein n=1 Tax=Leucocoprinus birnbaumii TaxID=56174 RepID=A0AAD5YRD1_9AGAR|nr:hypothetical protein NP233_g5981 [Leucocoprinus birnbaumii]
MESIHDHDSTPLAAPFIGFIVGTVEYALHFLSYHLIQALRTLDALHFILGAILMYAFLITNSGSVATSTKNTCCELLPIWLSTGSNHWISSPGGNIGADRFYLERIYRFSKNPILNGEKFRFFIKVALTVIASAAVSIGIAFAYEVQRVTEIPRLGGNLQWLIYLGYIAIASIDFSITVMMCYVLYKNRLEIGINHISRHSNRLLSNLISYALATGLVTTLFAVLGLMLYIARPDTFLYISVMFCITRLYANSMLAMFNVRKRLSSGLVTDSLNLGESTSGVVFQHGSLPIFSSTFTRRRQDNSRSVSSNPRHLHTIRTQQDPSLSDAEKAALGDESWHSAKGSLWSGETRIQGYFPRIADRRFSL